MIGLGMPYIEEIVHNCLRQNILLGFAMGMQQNNKMPLGLLSPEPHQKWKVSSNMLYIPWNTCVSI